MSRAAVSTHSLENPRDTQASARHASRTSAPSRPLRRALGALSWIAIVFVIAIVAAGAIVPRALGAVPLTVLSGSMRPGLQPGDLIVVRPVTDVASVAVGDVLTFQPVSDDPALVTHRLVAITRDASGAITSLTTRGDANGADDDPIVPGQVKGTLLYWLPKVGLLAHATEHGARSWIVLAVAAALLGYGAWAWGSAAREAWSAKRRA